MAGLYGPGRREALQRALDGQKTLQARNVAGQFATPGPLAEDVVALGLSALPERAPLRFLDPAFGLGAFYEALLARRGDRRLERALAFEKDAHYGIPAQGLWDGQPLELRLEDFTLAEAQPGFNLVVCNPPYVRHHHLDRATKQRLQAAVKAHTGISLSGLAGLYAHFLLLSLDWMEPDGIGVWLVPSELMDVGYGGALRRLFTEKVDLLRIHRADPARSAFEDALVSSAVLLFRKRPPGSATVFSFGGTLARPAVEAEIPLDRLRASDKWTSLLSPTPAREGTPLGELFTIRRGIATGANAFFIRPLEEWRQLGVPTELLVPILPGPRRMPLHEIEADADGSPRIEAPLYLLRCEAPIEEIDHHHPALAALLREAEPGVGQGYLCRHRQPWYGQERRDPPPLLCTYMGRSKAGASPFRFILNHSRAIATNVYLLLYPKAGPVEAEHLRPLWAWLNALGTAEITSAGRVYGGGLHKLEPAELGSLLVPENRAPGRGDFVR